MQTHYIYGLFDASGLCRYVGQTGSFRNRQPNHKRKYPSLEMRLIRRCEWLHRNRIEGQVIRAYRRLGQADLNTKLPNHRPPQLREPHQEPYVIKVARNGIETLVRQSQYDSVFGFR